MCPVGAQAHLEQDLVGLQAVDERELPPEALLKALLVGRELDREARRQQGVVPAGEPLLGSGCVTANTIARCILVG